MNKANIGQTLIQLHTSQIPLLHWNFYQVFTWKALFLLFLFYFGGKEKDQGKGLQ